MTPHERHIKAGFLYTPRCAECVFARHQQERREALVADAKHRHEKANRVARERYQASREPRKLGSIELN